MGIEFDWSAIIRTVSLIAVAVVAGLRFGLPAISRKTLKTIPVVPVADEPALNIGLPDVSPVGLNAYLSMIESETPLATTEQRWEFAKKELNRFDLLKLYVQNLESVIRESGNKNETI